MKYKTDLDQEVAFALQLPLKKVRAVTNAFVNILGRAIAEEGEAEVAGLGVFRLRSITTEGGIEPRRLMEKKYVRFFKSHALKRQIEEIHMEKYGVDEKTRLPEFLEKEAGEGSTCPKCGTRVERHGRILKCPQCGTEPFEE